MSDAQEALPPANAAGQEVGPEQSVPLDPESLARHYEQQDVDIRGIVRFGIAVAVAAVVAGTVLAVVLRIWATQPLPVRFQVAPAAVTPPAVPGPGLDAAPENNLQSYLARENQRLYGYGWVDREAGTVHIPIDEAMRMLVERGVPSREGDAPTFYLDPSFRLDSSGGLLPAGDDTQVDEPNAAEGNQSTDDDSGSDGSDAADESASEDSDDEAEEGGAADEGADSEESGGAASGGDTPDSESSDDDGSGAPGTIAPDDEDAGEEEPGGSQSGG
jgi:hypothetical protein